MTTIKNYINNEWIEPKVSEYAEVINPATGEVIAKTPLCGKAEVDAAAEVLKKTGDKGADVIFEVSGVQPGVDLMTAAGATRARIVMVAIHATKPQVDLFRFFWRELQLIGVRVYEPEDYDKAIASIAAGEIDADAMITDIRPLDKIGEAFAELTSNPNAMKSLLQING